MIVSTVLSSPICILGAGQFGFHPQWKLHLCEKNVFLNVFSSTFPLAPYRLRANKTKAICKARYHKREPVFAVIWVSLKKHVEGNNQLLQNAHVPSHACVASPATKTKSTEAHANPLIRAVQQIFQLASPTLNPGCPTMS